MKYSTILFLSAVAASALAVPLEMQLEERGFDDSTTEFAARNLEQVEARELAEVVDTREPFFAAIGRLIAKGAQAIAKKVAQKKARKRAQQAAKAGNNANNQNQNRKDRKRKRSLEDEDDLVGREFDDSEVLELVERMLGEEEGDLFSRDFEDADLDLFERMLDDIESEFEDVDMRDGLEESMDELD